MPKPNVILVVMDGWGYGPNTPSNAIVNAQKPNFDNYWQNYPHTLLSASGEAVGLPWGGIGSSEVGHLSLGSGRVIYQDLPRVSQAIENGTFYQNPQLIGAINHAKQHRSALHLIGLVSSGGVHSHIRHLEALLQLIKVQRFKNPTFIHMITDGRDTSPKSAPMYLEKLIQRLHQLHLPISIATVSGRYYAMDRDNHWERTLSAYKSMVSGEGQIADSPASAIETAYRRQETDEFIMPTIIAQNAPSSGVSKLFSSQTQILKVSRPVQDNDAIIFFNFRPERMRQLVELFLFPRQDMPDKITRKNLYITTMTQYSEHMPVHCAFPPEYVDEPLARILSNHQLTQLHIAETEKYAHATYFFNGGNPQPYPGEKWYAVPSPKVATYDLAPAMSASKITDYLIDDNQKNPYDFMLINYANADMVGHTGNYDATVKAIEAIDQELGRLQSTFPDSYLIITADHGNAENLTNPETGEIDTEHSISPVPLIIIHPSFQLASPQAPVTLPTGILADITPTILNLFGLEPLPQMNGYNLLPTLIPNYRPMPAKV